MKTKNQIKKEEKQILKFLEEISKLSNEEKREIYKEMLRNDEAKHGLR
jgi:PHD/YefM family antitoxin component YafN of YafNO toxin-antitoxin module